MILEGKQSEKESGERETERERRKRAESGKQSEEREWIIGKQNELWQRTLSNNALR
jgi:hypothetical protein